MPSILTRIRLMEPAMQPAEQRLAQFIRSSPTEVLHLSLAELANTAGVSEATITRFSHQLGLFGYQELKLAIAQESIQPSRVTPDDIRRDDPPETIIQKVIGGHIANLRQTMETLDPKTLVSIIEIIEQARRIYFVGIGRSVPNTIDAYNKFLQLGFACYCFTEGHIQATAVSLTTKEDLVFAITLSGTSKDLYTTLEIARRQGATTAAITGFGRAPITQVSDHVLFFSPPSSKRPSDPIVSRLAQVAIIDVIWTTLAIRNPERSARLQHTIESVLGERQL